MIGKKRVSAVIIGILIFLNCAVTADTIGPVYTPPGGLAFSSTGDMVESGGAILTYSGFDDLQYDQLWWGPWDDAGVSLTMNGSSPPHTLRL